MPAPRDPDATRLWSVSLEAIRIQGQRHAGWDYRVMIEKMRAGVYDAVVIDNIIVRPHPHRRPSSTCVHCHAPNFLLLSGPGTESRPVRIRDKRLGSPSWTAR